MQHLPLYGLSNLLEMHIKGSEREGGTTTAISSVHLPGYRWTNCWPVSIHDTHLSAYYDEIVCAPPLPVNSFLWLVVMVVVVLVEYPPGRTHVITTENGFYFKNPNIIQCTTILFQLPRLCMKGVGVSEMR